MAGDCLQLRAKDLRLSLECSIQRIASDGVTRLQKSSVELQQFARTAIGKNTVMLEDKLGANINMAKGQLNESLHYLANTADGKVESKCLKIQQVYCKTAGVSILRGELARVVKEVENKLVMMGAVHAGPPPRPSAPPVFDGSAAGPRTSGASISTPTVPPQPGPWSQAWAATAQGHWAPPSQLAHGFIPDGTNAPGMKRKAVHQYDGVYDGKVAGGNRCGGPGDHQWLKTTRCYLGRAPGARALFRHIVAHPVGFISPWALSELPTGPGMRLSVGVM